MDKKAFLVTGTGRSGTTFLAETLNRSYKWEIAHESPNDHLYLDCPKSQAAGELRDRFGKIHYGEVNSQLRRIAPELSSRGLRVYFIVRNPIDIIKSVHTARERSKDQFLVTLYQILPALTDVFLLKLLGFQYFRFEKMTTDKHYFCDMANELGVDDINIGKINFRKKVNSNGTGTIEDWDIGPENKSIFLDKCGWFMREFGYRE